MCVVSMIGDWQQQQWAQIPRPIDNGSNTITWIQNNISRLEFDALKKEVEELKSLLVAAKKYDEQTGQPNCEQEKKVELLKKVAEAVGVNLEEVFKK